MMRPPLRAVGANHVAGALEGVVNAALDDLDLSRISAAPGARSRHLPFRTDRGFPAQSRMPTARVIDTVDVVKMAVSGCRRVSRMRRQINSAFMVLKTVSTAVLTVLPRQPNFAQRCRVTRAPARVAAKAPLCARAGQARLCAFPDQARPDSSVSAPVRQSSPRPQAPATTLSSALRAWSSHAGRAL